MTERRLQIQWTEGCKLLRKRLSYDGKKVAKCMGEGCKIIGRRLQYNEKKVANCWEEGWNRIENAGIKVAI
jgi:hypothetical protein